ncbi:hypothetical protein [Opitutus sp. ER46]|uniref:hypothetical protein n=1 Tax=Opitutus sp. ER46 TaxID=2161864 RepID=UPI0011B1E55C|nr:hypothetical protein [Opitutus sp. ER46]
MTPSFVTWQLNRLHEELDTIDAQRDNVIALPSPYGAKQRKRHPREEADRRALLDRMLRALPKRYGFRDARAFAYAFARANNLLTTPDRVRHRLTAAQVRELERRVLAHESPSRIARVIGCAEQTVLNRASQLRKRLAEAAERDASGI